MKTEEWRLTDAQREFAEKNIGLVGWFMRSHHLHSEDDYDACVFGLLRAAHTYDQDYGVRFSTYASKVMETEVKKAYRARHKKSVIPPDLCVSMFSPLPIADDDDLWLLDTIEGDSLSDGDIVAMDEGRRFFDSLRSREQKIVHMLSVGYNQVEIAEALGVSHQRVHQVVTDIRRRGERFRDGWPKAV